MCVCVCVCVCVHYFGLILCLMTYQAYLFNVKSVLA